MSKTADFYTEVFDNIISADASYNCDLGTHSFPDMAAYGLMRKAVMMLLDANGMKETFEEYSKTI